MKIAVIGAGIVGVTTAYELGLDGHAVTVFERRGAVAEESSFATAGVLAPGLLAPWAGPGRPGKVLAQLFKRHAATALRWPLGRAELAWIGRWWRECGLESYLTHRAQMHQLAAYSQSRLNAISERLRLEFDRTDGCLLLLRTERDLNAVQPGLQLLRDLGIKIQQFDAAHARRLEPALHAGTSLAAAIACPGDGVGNCRHFALMLRTEAQSLGVRFRFGTTVQSLTRSAGGGMDLAMEGARADSFDAVVVCAGAPSLQLLHPLGIRPALLPIHGHSISAAVREPLDAPRSAVIDHCHGVTIARQGQRIRVAGGAELGGNPGNRSPRSLRTLYAVLQDWFPGAASVSGGVQEWKGSYPMTAEGTPLVGASGVPGLWLNIGHGDGGWAMACGSARIVADLVLGHAPEIDPAPLAPTGRLG
jgi:D-amino-acid dehydrogenase